MPLESPRETQLSRNFFNILQQGLQLVNQFQIAWSGPTKTFSIIPPSRSLSEGSCAVWLTQKDLNFFHFFLSFNRNFLWKSKTVLLPCSFQLGKKRTSMQIIEIKQRGLTWEKTGHSSVKRNRLDTEKGIHTICNPCFFPGNSWDHSMHIVSSSGQFSAWKFW